MAMLPVHTRLPWVQSPGCSCPELPYRRCRSGGEWGTFLHPPPATHTCSTSYQSCRMSSLLSVTSSSSFLPPSFCYDEAQSTCFDVGDNFTMLVLACLSVVWLQALMPHSCVFFLIVYWELQEKLTKHEYQRIGNTLRIHENIQRNVHGCLQFCFAEVFLVQEGVGG